jgi:hypothetical protein
MAKAWGWIKAKAKWIALVAVVVLLAVAVALAFALRAETARRRLQEMLANARGQALAARHVRDAEVETARDDAETERAKTEAEHDAETEDPEAVADGLDEAAGKPDAELDEVNEWIRSHD